MARRAPCGGWDSALPEESRPSNRLAVRQVTGHCRPFGGQVFLIASTRCRFTRVSSGGFRDGETGRHVGCVHGRHGGGRHAWPVDRPRGCTGGSHGNRWTFGKEPERQRAGGRIWCSRPLSGATGAGQRTADSAGPPAYVTRGCVLEEGPWLDEPGPSTISLFLRPRFWLSCSQARGRDHEGGGVITRPSADHRGCW